MGEEDSVWMRKERVEKEVVEEREKRGREEEEEEVWIIVLLRCDLSYEDMEVSKEIKVGSNSPS